ncbi:unnamed protein product [Meloidogyne enterolobii]|uniref:Uncharacterized protein n=1 Tax=Meloidogyne enterolobii TaxID=390850 RepID=A0ACB0Z2P5_MELEN
MSIENGRNNVHVDHFVGGSVDLLMFKATTEEGIYKNEETGEPICGEYETYTLARFLFVSGASLFAFLGLAANLLLFYLFSQTRNGSASKANQPPPTLYPRMLALLDACICAAYILLFGVDAISYGMRSKSLFLLYHWYIVPAFVVARMAQLAIPYMLIFASLERLVWIGGKLRNSLLRRLYSVQGRQITMAITLLACVLLRAPTVWATTVHHYPKCNDFFRSLSAGPADWVFESQFYQLYDFHLLSVAQTVFPFFLLLAINLIVIRRVSKAHLSKPLIHHEKKEKTTKTPTTQPILVNQLSTSNSFIKRKSSFRIHKLTLSGPVRSAVYTMVCIVCTYLISNSLHLALTVLEKSNSALLKDPSDPSLASPFHTAFSDAVSFVYMFTSAIRILIYYSCNPQIRIQIKHCLSFGSKCTSNNNVCEEEESSSNNYSYQQKQQSTTTTIYLPFNVAKNTDNFGSLNVNNLKIKRNFL